MIARRLGLVMLLLAAFLLLPESGLTQPGKGRGPGSKGGFPGGGFPGGGTPGGTAGGGMLGGMMRGDPGQIFDYLAKDRGYFVIKDSRTFGEPLTKWAEKNGITNGQVTRQQFMSFMEEYSNEIKSKIMGGGAFGGGAGGFRPPGSGGPGDKKGSGPVPVNDAEMMAKWAEFEFKRRDSSGDGQLNADEMEGKLRDNVSQWDSNRDGLINLDEYKPFFTAKMQERNEKDAQKFNPVTIIIEDELEKRPVVFRAGKVPKDIEINGSKMKFPSWFEELDIDKDGQVSLFEWRKAGREIEDFDTYDRNGDALITIEEVIGQQRTTLAKNGNGGIGGENSAVIQLGPGNQFSNGSKGGADPRKPSGDSSKSKGGFGGGFGGFGKSKKK